MAADLLEPDDALLGRAMDLALEQARAARDEAEVPVGAVVLDRAGEILALGRNEILGLCDPTAHAERLALSRACVRVGAARLPRGSLLASTLEPCAMCAGAIVLARVDWLVFGALDPKTGACGSLRDVVGDPRLNHRARVLPRRREMECGRLLIDFFRDRRPDRPAGG